MQETCRNEQQSGEWELDWYLRVCADLFVSRTINLAIIELGELNYTEWTAETTKNDTTDWTLIQHADICEANMDRQANPEFDLCKPN